MSASQPSADDVRTLHRFAAAAAVVTVLTRLPLAAERMWDHDSVQFALAVEHFDLAAHHPHPPGYPVYVALLKLLAWMGLEPLAGMVMLTLVAGAVGAAAMVLLGARLAGGERGGRVGGLLAGALYLTNPLLWFYGELPLVYAVEAGMALMVAWAVARMADGEGGPVLPCVLLGLAGGLRPSTLILLSPLVLYGVVRSFRDGRLTLARCSAGAAAGGGAVALWLFPLLRAAGGLAAYRELSARHFGALLPQTSVLYGAGAPALLHNCELLVKWAAQGLVPGVLAVAVAWGLSPRRAAEGLRRLAPRLGFLLAWALPPVLFFALFHITKAGYTLIHLPALLVVCAVVATPALDGSRPRSAWAVGLALLAGASLFLFGRDREPAAPRWQALVRHEHQRGTLVAFERELDQALAAVQRFAPETTELVAVELAGLGAAGSEGFLYPWHRHLQWYLPRYRLLYLAPDVRLAATARGHEPLEPQGTEIEIPEEIQRLVFVLSAPPGRRLVLPPGDVVLTNSRFYLLAAPFAGEVRVGPFRLHAPSAR